MRMCVTGATGRIGEAFLALASRQPTVRLRVLSRRAAVLPSSASIEWIEGDLIDPGVCDRLLQDQDVLVHMAWSGAPLAGGGFAAGLNDGLIQTLNLLDAARRCGNLRIVLPASGGTVYIDNGEGKPHREEDACDPISPYAIQKLAAEHYVKVLCSAKAASARILRISTGYGWRAKPGAQQGFIGIACAAAMAAEPVRLIGDPNNVRDYIHRDDIAEALLLAASTTLDHGRAEVINIGSSVGTSVRQVLMLLEEELGRRVTTRHEKWDTEQALPGYSVLDTSRARELLGWAPRIALREGIRMAIREFQSLSA